MQLPPIAPGCRTARCPDRQTWSPAVGDPHLAASACRAAPMTTNNVIVMNTILGGSFTSRLNQNLREKHGYNIRGRAPGSISVRWPDHSSQEPPFRPRSPTLRSLKFFSELKGILRAGPPERPRPGQELCGRFSFPGDFQTVGQIASQMEDLFIYDLPDDTFKQIHRSHPWRLQG